jgi:hypothetical protein
MLTQIELTRMKTSMCTMKKHTAWNNSTSSFLQKKRKKKTVLEDTVIETIQSEIEKKKFKKI